MRKNQYRHRRTVRPSSPFRLDREQSGQAIVIVAVIMVVLIGMAAVAIDGGGLMVLQRDAQNAADAAAFEAATRKCAGDSDADWQTKGANAATNNGFTTGTNGVTVTIQELPSSELPAGASGTADQYVQAIIEAPADPYFAQVVYDGPLGVTVESVSRCNEGGNEGTVPAIMALGSCPGSGYPNEYCANNSGNSTSINVSDVSIEGGLHSNCDCAITANAANPSTIEGGLTCVRDVEGSASDQYTADPPAEDSSDGVEWMSDPLDGIYEIEYYAPGGWYASLAQADTCSASGDAVASDGDTADCYHHFNSNLSLNPSGSGTFEGIYFVEGDITINRELTVGPKGVTFVSDGGEIDLGKLPLASPVIRPYEHSGFLFAFTDIASCNKGIDIAQANDNAFHGVVYAPTAQCNLSMAVSTTLWGAYICQGVTISGSNVEIRFSPELLPPQPDYVLPSE